MSDGVIRQWIATGIPCSTLNKQLQQARTGSPDDKQRMGTFVKAMGSRFQRMEGLFELEWPAGGAARCAGWAAHLRCHTSIVDGRGHPFASGV